MGETQFVKFKSAFRPKSRAILFKEVGIACCGDKNNSQTGLAESELKLSTTSFSFLGALSLDAVVHK